MSQPKPEVSRPPLEEAPLGASQDQGTRSEAPPAVPSLSRYRVPLLLLLLGAGVPSLFKGGAEAASVWKLPLAAALGVLATALVSWLFGRAVRRSGEGEDPAADASFGHAPPGFSSVGWLVQLAQASALLWLGWRAAGATDLHGAAGALLALSAVDLLLQAPRGIRRTTIAWAVGLGAPLALRMAGSSRLARGGDLAVEWLGIPMGGDPATTIAFFALIVPLALPPWLGGTLSGLVVRPRFPSRFGVGFAVAAFARSAAYLVLLARTFAGTEQLLWWGVGAALLVPATASLQARPGRRLAWLSYASLWTLLALLAAATARSLAAFQIGVVGWCLSLFVVALAAAFVRWERGSSPGIGPHGLARLFPVSFLASAAGVASLVGVPVLVGTHGRVRGAGALEVDGEWEAAVLLALSGALLLVWSGLPWLREVFFDPPSAADTVTGARRREPMALVLLLFLGGLALLILGVAPSLATPLLPLGEGSPLSLPSPSVLVQVFASALLVASFLGRSTTDPGRAVSSPR